MQLHCNQNVGKPFTTWIYIFIQKKYIWFEMYIERRKNNFFFKEFQNILFHIRHYMQYGEQIPYAQICHNAVTVRQSYQGENKHGLFLFFDKWYLKTRTLYFLMEIVALTYKFKTQKSVQISRESTIREFLLLQWLQYTELLLYNCLLNQYVFLLNVIMRKP